MKSMFRGIKSYSLVVLSGVALAMIAPGFVQAQEGVKTSLRLIELGQPTKAIEVMNKSLSATPDNTNINYYLAYAQMKAGLLDEATATLDKGIAKNEKDALLYAGKGHVLFLKKNTVEGTVLLDKAAAMSKSKSVPVLQAIGRAYLSDPKFLKQAITTLDKAKVLQNNNPETYLLLGDAHLMQNNGGSAVSNYEWAGQYDPTSGAAHQKVGKIYLRTKDYKLAEASFQKAIKADPDYAPAYDELAELAYVNKDGAAATKYYEKYLELTGNQDKDRGRYAYYVLMTKDFAKANSIFNELVKKPDVSLTTRRYYAFSLFEEGKFPEAKDAFDQYFAKADTSVVKAADYNYAGQTQLELKNDSLASDYFKKSLDKESNQPEVVRMLAETQYRRKKYEDASVLYKQMISAQKTPSSKDLFSLGRAYYFTKNFYPADTAFTKLIEQQPTIVAPYLWEGRTKASIEEAEKKPGLAKPYYEKVVELASQTPDKNKSDIIEAYRYLASYAAIEKNDMTTAKSYMTKILAIDPKQQDALNFFAELKKAEQKK